MGVGEVWCGFRKGSANFCGPVGCGYPLPLRAQSGKGSSRGGVVEGPAEVVGACKPWAEMTCGRWCF